MEILAWFITWFNKWKHFSWQFLLSLWPLCLIVFPFSLHFLYSKLFRNRCILKSLIATSTNFLLKKNWKKKTWKVLFRRQSLGSQVEILVSQTAEICHCSLYSSLHTRSWFKIYAVLNENHVKIILIGINFYYRSGMLSIAHLDSQQVLFSKVLIFF